MRCRSLTTRRQCRVLEKAGYTREALLRASSVKYGIPKDQLLFSRINPAWNNPPRST